MASVLSPLREFGFFVGMCVVGCFLFISLLVPPAMAISERWCKCKWPCLSACTARFGCQRRSSDLLVGESVALTTGLGLTPLELSRLRSVGFDEVELMRRLTDPTSEGLGEEEMQRLGGIGLDRDALKMLPGLRQPASNSSLGQKCLFFLAKRLMTCPATCMFVFLLTFAGFVFGISQNLTISLDMPELLPPEHNYQRAILAKRSFVSNLADHPTRGALCDPQAWETDDCVAQWCEAEVIVYSDEVQGAGSAASDWMTGAFVPMLDCWRSPTIRGGKSTESTDITGCGNVSLHMRASTIGNPPANLDNQLVDYWKMYFAGSDFGPNNMSFPSLTGSDNWESLKLPLGLENWEMGEVEDHQLWGLPNFTAHAAAPDDANSACDILLQCFMARTRCKMNGWIHVGQFRYEEAVEEDNGSLDVVDTPASSNRITGGASVQIYVIWGVIPESHYPILGTTASPPLNLDTSFHAKDLWAQRAMYAFCTEEVPKHFSVVSSNCWVKDFRNWLVKNNKHFPTRYLTRDLTEWQRIIIGGPLGTSYDAAGSMNNVVKGEDGNVSVSRIGFKCRINNSQPEGILEFMKAWQMFIEVWNTKAPDSANKAIVASADAVDAFTDVSILRSTLETVIIAALCGFCSILSFTYSVVLATYVTILTLYIITGLLFYMTTIMRWTLGPIDILALIIFVGYAVTYSLHIAHAYHHIAANDPNLLDMSFRLTQKAATPSERKFGLRRGRLRNAKAAMAMYRLGGAVISSAISTMAASSFLLFCTFTPFPKMGWVILAVTFLSVAASLLVLPPLLMLAGPLRCLQHLPRCLLRRFSNTDLEAQRDLETKETAEFDAKKQPEGPKKTSEGAAGQDEVFPGQESEQKEPMLGSSEDGQH